MELLAVVVIVGLLLWAILRQGKHMAEPIPETIPPESRGAFQMSWLAVCLIIIVVATILVFGFAGAGLAISYEQQGLCDNSIRVPNPPFGTKGQCTLMVIPDD